MGRYGEDSLGSEQILGVVATQVFYVLMGGHGPEERGGGHTEVWGNDGDDFM